ncbi:hypothetical protein [Salmonirosea aquatica]|uniref:Lipocalin-like domain-containing protein n=1 Tax=Salmonirosea aquatica TaxID=2654236 RepID=A0A7C9FG70_9BACT|nr:hypothetical protein [Cytophagaceae bacterium SJW1-29]
MVIRFKYLSVMMLLMTALFSCNTKDSSEQGEGNGNTEYLGTWKRIPKQGHPVPPDAKVVTFTISEKDGGFFMQYNNGTTYPLKYEAEGNYYYAVTPKGSVPLLFDQGVITINNGFEFKYQKSSGS